MADRYASLRQGLVGCWIPSVSGSGLLLPDLSGRGNNGSLVGMDASDWVSAQYGRALDFDGVNDRVESRSISYQSLPLTVAVWVKPNTVSGVQILASHYGAEGNRAWYLGLINAAPRILVSPDGTLFPYGQGGTVTTDWTHVVGVVGPSAFQIYLNGIAVSTTLTGTYPTQIFNSTANVVLGDRATTDAPLNGQLNDIRLYSRALSDSEIRLLSSEPGIGFKPAKKLSRFSQRFTYKPAKPRNYSVIRNRDPNYSTLRHGLVAAYCPSISGQGNVLPDLVGGNHGTLTNMTAEDWVSSGDGRALDFDGTNDYVNTGTQLASLNGIASFTMMFWGKRRAANSALTVGKRSADADYILIAPWTDGNVYFEMSGFFPAASSNLTSWAHYAMTLRNGTIKGYINGVEVASGTGPATVPTVASNYLLGLEPIANRYSDGQIDDFRVYSRALTESEIKLLASKRGIGLQPRNTHVTFTDLGVQKTYSVVRVKETDYATLRQGLVGAWCPSLPNGGSGNTLPDVSGYGNHGVLTNMGPEDWVSGQYGRALDFDGSNDYVNLPSINLTNLFTVSFWYYARTITTNDGLVHEAISTAGIRFNSGIQYYSSNLSVLRIPTAPVGIWTHVAFTRDASGSVIGYLNGINSASGSGTGFVVDGLAYDYLISESRVLDGFLDDVRFYNRALSEPEIKLLASRPGIGLRQESHRQTFYQFPSGARRKRILTGMP